MAITACTVVYPHLSDTMLQSLGARVPEACLHVRQCCTHPAAVCNVFRPCQLHASQQAGNIAVRLLSRGAARAQVRTHAQSLEEVREDVMAQRRALREFPTAAFGQVSSLWYCCCAQWPRTPCTNHALTPASHQGWWLVMSVNAVARIPCSCNFAAC